MKDITAVPRMHGVLSLSLQATPLCLNELNQGDQNESF